MPLVTRSLSLSSELTVLAFLLLPVFSQKDTVVLHFVSFVYLLYLYLLDILSLLPHSESFSTCELRQEVHILCADLLSQLLSCLHIAADHSRSFLCSEEAVLEDQLVSPASFWSLKGNFPWDCGKQVPAQAKTSLERGFELQACHSAVCLAHSFEGLKQHSLQVPAAQLLSASTCSVCS